MSDLFRDKSLEQVRSPEQLNDYIRVTTPPVWLALIASTILLLGALAWAVLGTVNYENEDGSTKPVHPITFVTNRTTPPFIS